MTDRRLAGPILGIIVLVAFLLLPPIEPLTPIGMKTIGVFCFTIVWWISLGIDYPSIICMLLLIVTGVSTPEGVFAFMGHWIIFFVLGCFGMSESLKGTGFSRRFAFWFLTRSFAKSRPWVLIALFLLACTLMGAVMSTTVTVIVFMGIAISMLDALGYKRGDTFPATLIMGIGWAATASFAMTPIGHVSNILMMEWIQRDFGYTVTFPQWMAVGIPMGLLAYVIMMLFFRFAVRPDVSKFSEMANVHLQKEAGKIGRMSTEEKLAVGIFSGAVICWVFPGLAKDIWPGASTFLNDLGLAIPALAGASLLCFIRINKKPLLTFSQWMGGIEWGAVIMIVAILALGEAIGNPLSGIPQMLTSSFGSLVDGMPLSFFLLVNFIWVTVQTNVLSNLISMTVVYNIMAPIAASGGLCNPAALGVTIAAASHYAFALPSATIATALVVGSGWVPVRYLLTYGVLLIAPMVLMFTFLYYPLAALVLQ